MAHIVFYNEGYKYKMLDELCAQAHSGRRSLPSMPFRCTGRPSRSSSILQEVLPSIVGCTKFLEVLYIAFLVWVYLSGNTPKSFDDILVRTFPGQRESEGDAVFGSKLFQNFH